MKKIIALCVLALAGMLAFSETITRDSAEKYIEQFLNGNGKFVKFNLKSGKNIIFQKDKIDGFYYNNYSIALSLQGESSDKVWFNESDGNNNINDITVDAKGNLIISWK